MEELKMPAVSYNFVDISEVMQEEVTKLVDEKLHIKMLSAFKKIYSKNTDVSIKLDVHLERNKKGKYEGVLSLSYDGELIQYTPDIPFKILTDIISHAFDRFKNEILAK